MVSQPTAGEPVVQHAAPRRSVAIVAVVAALAIVIGAVLGAFLIAGRGAGAGAGAEYVPATTAVYVEANLDLPSAQRQALVSLIGRFPNLNGETVLGTPLDTFLDNAVAKSPTALRYTTDVKPWFNGQIAVAVPDVTTSLDPRTAPTTSAIVLFGVRDVGKLQAFADKVRAEAQRGGATFSSTVHDGVTIWSEKSGTATRGASAYAVTDTQLIVGSGADIVARALDVRAGKAPSLAGRSDVRDLIGRLPADRAGLMVTDGAAIAAGAVKSLNATNPALGKAYAQLLAGYAPLMVGALRFAADRVAVDVVAPAPTGDMALQNGTSSLAAHVPADAILFAEGPNIGRAWTRLISIGKLAADASPQVKQQLTQVESALGAKLEDFVSWIGEGAVVVGVDGATPYGGAILVATDPQAAQLRLQQLAALAKLGTAPSVTSGVSIQVSESQVSGTTVTTIRFGLTPANSAGTGLTSLAIQYAIADGRVVLGIGDRFVARVLQLGSGPNLAANPRFSAALQGLGGEQNAGTFYLDVAQLRGVVSAALPATVSGPYQATVEPYLAPLDYLAGVTRIEGDRLVQRAALVLK